MLSRNLDHCLAAVSEHIKQRCSESTDDDMAIAIAHIRLEILRAFQLGLEQAQNQELSMKQTIYGIMRDNGDGSCSLEWFRNRDTVDRLLEDDDYWPNNGLVTEALTFPASLDLDACGFTFSDDAFTDSE